MPNKNKSTHPLLVFLPELLILLYADLLAFPAFLCFAGVLVTITKVKRESETIFIMFSFNRINESFLNTHTDRTIKYI